MRRVLVVCCFIIVAILSQSLILIPSSRGAEAAPSVQNDTHEVLLLDGQTLLGWEQSAGAAASWIIAGGRVQGTSESGTLQLEQTFGDAVWTIRWKPTNDGILELDFPLVPEKSDKKSATVSALKVRLTSGARCGEIVEGDKIIAAGTALPATSSADHTARVTRRNGRLTVSVNDKEVSGVPWPAAVRTGFSLRVPKGTVDVVSIAVREEGFHPLFNGHNLAEFNVGDARVRWVVDKEGKIVTESPQGNYLRTNGLYENFTLSLEYKISAGGNSGVGIRTPTGGWPSSDGMEVQILDQPDTAAIFSGSVGSLYRNMPPLRRTDLRSPAWNRLVIKADGPMIAVWINGRIVNHCNLARHYVLRSRGRSGWIGFQDHGGKVEFRNTEIVEAPPGDRFANWTAPQPATAAGMALGAVLDPIEALPARRLQESVIHGRHPGREEATANLADLTGPGAVTRFFRSNSSGELAFYFDGEATPRLVTSWNKLATTLQDLGSSKHELFTFLPFRKSLRIEQRGSRPATYQIGWLGGLTGKFPLESGSPTVFTGEDRGWQHAIEYLRHNHAYGTTSIHPGVIPSTAGVKSVAPGESVVLAEISRSGISRWLQFKLPEARVLGGTQLWLDIFVDGESRPSISAPLRLLLPALVPELGETPEGDLLQVRKQETYTWLWPMPCARGIKVVARNTGTAPLSGISATIGLLPRDVHDIPTPRLRGLYFRPKSTDSKEWLSATGKGRLVWLSLDAGDADLGTISKLLIDGEPKPAWENLPIAGWLGRDTPAAPHNSGHGGSVGTLIWRNFLVDPFSFNRSLQLDLSVPPTDWQTLALYYIQPVERHAKR